LFRKGGQGVSPAMWRKRGLLARDCYTQARRCWPPGMATANLAWTKTKFRQFKITPQ
jgi:hypothetical protein